MKKNSIISKQIPLLAAMFLLVLMIAAPFSRTSANSLTTVDLSGSWTFTPQGGSATTIQVPGGGWYKQGFTSVNEADYQRTITIPNTGQPQVTKIEFGAINYEASLYINNNLVATQRTSFTPSVFDITNFVTPGNSYTLKVHVKGKNASYDGVAENHWSPMLRVGPPIPPRGFSVPLKSSFIPRFILMMCLSGHRSKIRILL